MNRDIVVRKEYDAIAHALHTKAVAAPLDPKALADDVIAVVTPLREQLHLLDVVVEALSSDQRRINLEQRQTINELRDRVLQLEATIAARSMAP